MTNRIFILAAALLMCLSLAAQQTHIVRSGETINTVADKYHVSIEQLKQANPFLNNLYTGMEINIPASTVLKNESTPVSAAVTRVAQAYINNAVELISQGKFNKATKELDLSIEEQPSTLAYFLRGKCHYMRNKWKKTCEDLNLVLEDESISEDMRSQATQMVNSATQLHAEKVDFWANILKDATAMAADLGQQKLLEEQMVSQAGHATNDKEFNANLQQIYRKAGSQMRKEQVEGFISYKSTMKNVLGVDVSYEDYKRAQVEQFTAEQEAKRAAATEGADDNDEEEEVIEEEEEENQKVKSKEKNNSKTNTTKTISKPTKTTTPKTTTKQKEEKLDAKQQWKRGKVSSNTFDEYRDKRVNLYRHQNGIWKLVYERKPVYRKGGEYYINIGSTYYKVEYSNMGGPYNKMIIYGAGGNLYFYL